MRCSCSIPYQRISSYIAPKIPKSSYAFYILLYNEKDDGDSYVKLSLLDTRPLLSDRLPTLTIADELKCHNYNVHDFDGDTRLFAYLHESVDNEGDKYYLTAIDTTIADKPVRTSRLSAISAD